MAFDLDAAIRRRIAEILPTLPPMTDEDFRQGAAILASARPPSRQQNPAA